ncbi:MAG: FKBP-type peptidyl-prolyl cis-trans isomerase N-terminal domain-containing protein [Planctomycetota bacterium]
MRFAMTSGRTLSVALGGAAVLAGLCVGSVRAEEAVAATAPATQPAAVPVHEVPGFEAFEARSSYVLGRQMARSFKTYGIAFDQEAFAKGVADAAFDPAGFDGGAEAETQPAAEGEPLLDEEQMMQAQSELDLFTRQRAAELQQQAIERVANENAAKAASFLTANADEDGVVVTESGLQYRVLQDGEGAKPGDGDVVRLHFTMSRPGERPFLNSRDRGQPTELPVDQTPLGGWGEGLRLMPAGSTYTLFLPPELAFGPAGQQGLGIAPNEVLVMEVELLEVVSPPEAAEAPEAAAGGAGGAGGAATQPVE